MPSYLVYEVLGIELRALGMLGKHSTDSATSSTLSLAQFDREAWENGIIYHTQQLAKVISFSQEFQINFHGFQILLKTMLISCLFYWINMFVAMLHSTVPMAAIPWE